jgi:hypothetical protein
MSKEKKKQHDLTCETVQPWLVGVLCADLAILILDYLEWKPCFDSNFWHKETCALNETSLNDTHLKYYSSCREMLQPSQFPNLKCLLISIPRPNQQYYATSLDSFIMNCPTLCMIEFYGCIVDDDNAKWTKSFQWLLDKLTTRWTHIRCISLDISKEEEGWPMLLSSLIAQLGHQIVEFHIDNRAHSNHNREEIIVWPTSPSKFCPVTNLYANLNLITTLLQTSRCSNLKGLQLSLKEISTDQKKLDEQLRAIEPYAKQISSLTLHAHDDYISDHVRQILRCFPHLEYSKDRPENHCCLS